MVKVGDKVRITANDYPTECPRGTICTVVDVRDHSSSIRATVDGGNNFRWFFSRGKYEPLTEQEPEPQYDYAEKAAQYGICITLELADGNVIIFDGCKCQDD